MEITSFKEILDKSLQELEEYGNLHEENCGCVSDENYPDECDCDMKGMKSFVEQKMKQVNEFWIEMAKAHRPYCSPAGNKMLTKMMGKKNANRGGK